LRKKKNGRREPGNQLTRRTLEHKEHGKTSKKKRKLDVQSRDWESHQETIGNLPRGNRAYGRCLSRQLSGRRGTHQPLRRSILKKSRENDNPPSQTDVEKKLGTGENCVGGEGRRHAVEKKKKIKQRGQNQNPRGKTNQLREKRKGREI